MGSNQTKLSDLGFGQWFLVATPTLAGLITCFFERHDMGRDMILLFGAGSLVLSAGMLFMMLYGDQL